VQSSKVITSIIDDDVNTSIDLNGFLRHLVELFERCGDIQLKNVSSLSFQVCKLGKGAAAGSSNDFVATLKSGKG
jgi:hypothetical protein